MWITSFVVAVILLVLKSEIGKNTTNQKNSVLPDRSEAWDFLHSRVQYNIFLHKLSEKNPTEQTTEQILFLHNTEKISSPQTSSQLQKSRVLQLRSVCENEYFAETDSAQKSINEFRENTGMNYDIKNDIFYCFNAKTGVTNWKTLASAVYRNTTIDEFKELMEHDEKINVYGDLPTLKGLHDQHILPNHITPKHGVILARHPLIRLYSAWAHRLSNSQGFHSEFSKGR